MPCAGEVRFFHVIIGELRADAALFGDARRPELRLCVDKDAEAVRVVIQQIVGAAADDYAGSVLRGDAAEDAPLRGKQLFQRREVLVIHRITRRHEIVNNAVAHPLLMAADEILRKPAFSALQRDELFVAVELQPELFRKLLPDLKPAGAKLAPDGDHHLGLRPDGGGLADGAVELGLAPNEA